MMNSASVLQLINLLLRVLQRSAAEHSSTCHCIHVYMFLHNLLNVLVQIANKMGLQKKISHTGKR
jgi:hypothetical protein